MYFGSVKFFKHLIITVIVLSILIPLILAITLSMQNKELRNEIQQLKQTISQSSTSTVSPIEPTTTTTEGLQQEPQNDLPKAPNAEDAEFPYQLAYPDLYARPKELVSANPADKKVYLTFDDGPSERTAEILDILDTYKIKATFFVVYKDDDYSKNLYKEIVKRGHTIAIHTASHDYDAIYDSVDDYLADFNKIYNQIYEVTGVKVDLFRYPGGSVNGFNLEIREPLIAEMARRGFTYHDWNISSKDATTGAITPQTIFSEIVSGVRNTNANKSVVLMHDGQNKTSTVAALPGAIENLQADGYVFEKLDNSIKPFTMKLEN